MKPPRQSSRALTPTRRSATRASPANANREAAAAVRAETGFPPGTFGEIATRYIGRECGRLARGAEIEAIIRRELLPVLGKRAFAELRRRDLHEIVIDISGSGRPAAAHKVREIGKRIASWSHEEELIEAQSVPRRPQPDSPAGTRPRPGAGRNPGVVGRLAGDGCADAQLHHPRRRGLAAPGGEIATMERGGFTSAGSGFGRSPPRRRRTAERILCR